LPCLPGGSAHAPLAFLLFVNITLTSSSWAALLPRSKSRLWCSLERPHFGDQLLTETMAVYTKQLLSFFLLAAVLELEAAPQMFSNIAPAYIQCTQTSDCGKGECCVIGRGRYSVPQCQPALSLGEMCIPEHQERRKTELYYPDGSSVLFKEVYYMCPCDFGLHCNNNTSPGTCEPNRFQGEFNDLDDLYNINYFDK